MIKLPSSADRIGSGWGTFLAIAKIDCGNDNYRNTRPMKPYPFVIETRNPLLPWQVHSSIVNQNAEFSDLGIKPDRYLAGFRTKEAAIQYVLRCYGELP